MLMKIFKPISEKIRSKYAELYAFYELAYTVVDFLAAALFILGSLLFFREETVYIGVWLYLIGSIGFALKPSIRLVREIHFLRKGQLRTKQEE